MNTPIVNDTYRLVKHLFCTHFPSKEANVKLEKSMSAKNLCVQLGRGATLADEELEDMALAALLQPLDELECGLSVMMAETLLTQWGLTTTRLLRVIDHLEVLSADLSPQTPADTLMLKAFDLTGPSPSLSARCRATSSLVS